MRSIFCFFLCIVLNWSATAQSSRQLDSLKRVLAALPPEGSSYSSDTTRVRVMCEMGEKESNIDIALSFTEKANIIARRVNWKNGIFISKYIHTQILWRNERFLKCLDEYIQILSFMENEQFGSNIQKAKIIRHIAIAYLWLKRYPEAYLYFNKSLDIFMTLHEIEEYADTLELLAITYYNDGDNEKAIMILNKCLKYIPYIKGNFSEASYYSNLGMVYGAMKKVNIAKYYFNKALNHYDKFGNKYELQKSRSLFMISELYFVNRMYNESLIYANLSLKYYNKKKIDSIELYEILYKLHRIKKNYQQSLKYFEKFKNSNDSATYISQKRQLESLSAAYSLNIEKNNNLILSQKLNKEYEQKRLVYLGIGFLFLFFIFIIYNYLQQKKKNKIISNQKNKIESLNNSLEIKVEQRTKQLKRALYEVKEAMAKGQTIERKRVASELHDNLGTTLSALKWRLEAINGENLNEKERKIYESILEMIKVAYSEVRLISHNLMPLELEKEGLKGAIAKIVNEINIEGKLNCIYLISENFKIEDKKIQLELYSIILELINNIMKHANATEVAVHLSQNEESYEIKVCDNGVGFNQENKGFGLSNIQYRIDSINGKIYIDSNNLTGTTVKIIVSISNFFSIENPL